MTELALSVFLFKRSDAHLRTVMNIFNIHIIYARTIRSFAKYIERKIEHDNIHTDRKNKTIMKHCLSEVMQNKECNCCIRFEY